MLLVVINSIAFRMRLTTWILLPGIRDVNPRLCPVLPKALGTFARRCRVKVLVVSGMSPHVRGCISLSSRAQLLMAVGTDPHGHWLSVVNLFCISVEPHIGLSTSFTPLQDVLLLFRNESCLS